MLNKLQKTHSSSNTVPSKYHYYEKTKINKRKRKASCKTTQLFKTMCLTSCKTTQRFKQSAQQVAKTTQLCKKCVSQVGKPPIFTQSNDLQQRLLQPPTPNSPSKVISGRCTYSDLAKTKTKNMEMSPVTVNQ